MASLRSSSDSADARDRDSFLQVRTMRDAGCVS